MALSISEQFAKSRTLGVCVLLAIFVGCQNKDGIFVGDRFHPENKIPIEDFAVFNDNGSSFRFSEAERSQLRVNIGKWGAGLTINLVSDAKNWAYRNATELWCECKFPDTNTRFQCWIINIDNEPYLLYDVPMYSRERFSDATALFRLKSTLSDERIDSLGQILQIEFNGPEPRL